MTVYYAQNGDAELTLYKEIATISTIDRKIYEFNEEGISADYWVVRFTSSGWIDLRLCSPSGLFTTGLYTEEFHQQIMDRLNGYQPVGDYQPKGNYVTTDQAGTISATKTFSSTPVLSTLKNKKVLGTDANGIIEAHNLEISDITNLQSSLDGKASKSHTHAISDIENLQSKLDTIPSIKTLNTNNSSALSVSSSEAISGSGSIKLHKVSKTGKFSDLSNRGEAFLSWGGQNFSGSYGPIDAAMVPELGANRLAFMPANAVTIEYSRDGGST